MRQILSALSRERMRIGCFERTGCLLRLLPHDDDSLVRPQGLPDYQIPIGTHHGIEALPPPAETVTPNESIKEELEDSIDYAIGGDADDDGDGDLLAEEGAVKDPVEVDQLSHC